MLCPIHQAENDPKQSFERVEAITPALILIKVDDMERWIFGKANNKFKARDFRPDFISCFIECGCALHRQRTVTGL
jgi:hypothetical protein